LFISGYPADFEVKRQHFGRCAFLQKPFWGEDLVRIIAELCGRLEDEKAAWAKDTGLSWRNTSI